MTKQQAFNVDEGFLGLAAHEDFVHANITRLKRMDRPDLIECGHQEFPHTCSSAAVVHHLAGNQDRARHYGEMVAPAAKAYFFGDWRLKVPTDEKKIDPHWWRDREPWIDQFRVALCWSVVLNDWASVMELAAYPDHGRSMERFDDEANDARREWFIAIAQYLRGEKVLNVAAEMEKLPGHSWRATMELGQGLDAILAKDTKAAQTHVTAFFKAHHKRKKSRQITDTISIDGTILYYLARHAGLDVQLDSKLYVYVIDLSWEG